MKKDDVRKLNEKEQNALKDIITVDGVSRMEAAKAIIASKALRGHPGVIFRAALDAGLIRKEVVGTDVTYYLINNNDKGGEKITPEIDDDIEYLIKNNYVYHDCKIDGKEVWGIGKNAITLVDKVIYDYSCHHKRNYTGEKTFHRFKEGRVQNKNSFNNGVEIGKKIINEYGRL